MSWLEPDQTDRDYVQQIQQESPQYYQLLCVLALALRIEPLLLRNARLQFTPGSDIELETEIWFSSIMHSRNAKACIIRGGIARALVDELAKNQKDYAQAWAFVQTHTRHWQGQDQLEQQLRLAARTNDTLALQNGFQQILTTLMNAPDDASKRDLSRWLKGAIPNVLTQNDPSETAHLLFQYTAAALGLPASWSANHQAGLASMPRWLLDALPGSKENSLGIQLHKSALECVAAESAKQHLMVKLPLPTPVLINTDRESAPRWESLWPGRKIRLLPGYNWLSLQTLDGQLYRFTVHNPKPTSEPVKTGSPSLQLLYMPEDREQAYQISELLKQQGIDIALEPEPNPVSELVPHSVRSILRLWSRASANYWQQAMKTDAANFARGLLLRTDPQVDLPVGFKPSQAIDFIDWHNPDHTEKAVQMIRQWLDAESQDIIAPDLDIETLLKELENPETRPRRRLAIGDRLAELGDPRKGVGVKEYEIIDYAPEVQRLLDELNDINTQPLRRLEIGNLLAEMGDPRPGVGLDDNGLPDIDWVEIPAGSFIYGEGENQQTLDLPKFKISRYPVTNSQFQAFIDARGYREERWWQGLRKPGPKNPRFKQANRPRETVSWYEAVAYTRWLSAQLGVKVSLPTEQQWEKAARGADGRVYPWGNEFRSGFANINETRVYNKGSYNLQETSAVGIYPHGESPYHVADMGGNVWEWCLNDYGRPDQIEVNQSTISRVLRGGSWHYGVGDLRSAYRSVLYPFDRDIHVGFRLARD